MTNPDRRRGRKPSISFSLNAAPALRKCLCCEKQFASDSIGNRICTACKDTAAYRSGMQSCALGPISRNGR